MSGTPFSRSPSLLVRAAWEQLTLPRLLAEQHFDLLYCPQNYAVFRSPIPQVLVDHNSWHHARASEVGLSPLVLYIWARRWMAKRSVLRADATVYLSLSFAASMAQMGFPAPTAIIYSGVSADWPAGQECSLIPECVTCQAGNYALAVHNWSRHKNMAWLVDVWDGLGGIAGLHLIAVGALPARGHVTKPNGARSRDHDEVTHILGSVRRDALPELPACGGLRRSVFKGGVPLDSTRGDELRRTLRPLGHPPTQGDRRRCCCVLSAE